MNYLSIDIPLSISKTNNEHSWERENSLVNTMKPSMPHPRLPNVSFDDSDFLPSQVMAISSSLENNTRSVFFSGSPIGDPIPTVTILGKIDGNKVGKLPEDEERLLRRRGIHIDTDLLKMESQPSISSYAWARIMELEESRTPSEEWNVGPVFYSPFLRDLDNLGLTLDPNL